VEGGNITCTSALHSSRLNSALSMGKVIVVGRSSVCRNRRMVVSGQQETQVTLCGECNGIDLLDSLVLHRLGICFPEAGWGSQSDQIPLRSENAPENLSQSCHPSLYFSHLRSVSLY
jgi:hypothetical protein